jgi:hypothetical protein
MENKWNTTASSCPMPPSKKLIKDRGTVFYLKELGLFFFRFGICPLCITASISYGLYRIFKSIGPKVSSSKILDNPETLNPSVQ